MTSWCYDDDNDNDNGYELSQPLHPTINNFPEKAGKIVCEFVSKKDKVINKHKQ